MSNLHMKQKEADEFFKKEKFRLYDVQYIFPENGGLLEIPLVTKPCGEDFTLDVRRSRIQLKKKYFSNQSEERGHFS